MRSFDERFVKRSVVGREGIFPSDVEGVQLVLERKEVEQPIRIDLGDRVYIGEGRTFWAPLYFIEEDEDGSEDLVAVLAFSTEIDVTKAIKAQEELPYIAIASPAKDKLTPHTWETHKADIRAERAKTIGSFSVISAGVVASIFYAYKKVKKV